MALGREEAPAGATMWSDTSRWTPAQHRAFVRDIEKGLDELSQSRRRVS
jgi:hypothetical protein